MTSWNVLESESEVCTKKEKLVRQKVAAEGNRKPGNRRTWMNLGSLT